MKLISPHVILFAFSFVLGCAQPEEPVADNSSSATVLVTVSGDVTVATLSDSNLVELQNGNTELSMKPSNIQKCSADMGGWGGNYGLSTSVGAAFNMDQYFTPYTPTTNDMVTGVDLFLTRYGTVTGDVSVALQDDNAGAPGTVLAVSNETYHSWTLNNAGGAFYPFTFTPAQNLSAGSTYHFVLVPEMDFATTGTAFVRIMYSSTCNNARFGEAQGHITANGNIFQSGGTGIIKVNSATTSLSAAGPWAGFQLDSGAPGKVWHLSTFATDENPSGETGSFLFDVGVTDNNSASYTDFALTGAGVRALANTAGQYLYVKAHFISDGSKDATLSALSCAHE